VRTVKEKLDALRRLPREWSVALSLWQVTLRDGTVWQFQATNANWGPGNMLVGIRDRVGHQLTIQRWVYPLNSKATHLPQRIVAPNGRTIEFTLDTTDITKLVVTQARDLSAGRTVSYSYDSQLRLTQVTDAGGGVTAYTYDGTSSRIHTITDGRGSCS
jgi:YD repeat-containing protein